MRNPLLNDPTVQERALALAEPDSYARHRLGFALHPTQAAVLRAVFKPKSRVVFRCANEVGKTRRVVTSAVLYCAEILRGTVVSTAGVGRQVFEQLIPSLKSFADRFPGWEFQSAGIKRPDGVQAYTGFATSDEHGFQGFHAEDGQSGERKSPLLVIVDEAQGVPDNIIRAAEDRCNPTFMLVCGSPGDPAGMFYQMETSLAAHYQHFKLTRPECVKSRKWWIDDDDITRMIEKYGRDHPFVQSTVFGEFASSVEDALLSLGEWDACLENAPAKRNDGQKHAFCDFAAGRDSNVLAVRVGNAVWIEKKWKERDTMAAVGEFVALFNKLRREHGFEATDISGDADGLGLPMIHRLREVGWPINEFHGGSAPRFEDGYKNAVTEAWGEGAAKIKRKEIMLPADLDLKSQVLSRRCRRNSSGKMELEQKEEMRKRGLCSPDEADAVFGAMMPAQQCRSVSLVRATPKQIETDWSGGGQQEDIGERRYFT